MNTTFQKRVMAAALSAVLLTGTVTAAGVMDVSAEDTTPSTTTVYFNDFESGDVTGFTKRGDDTDNTTITAATGEAYSGNGYMSVTGRSKSWHGPSFSLDSLCTPGEQYTVSLAVKTPWYATVTLSMQYNDSSGTAHYTNLESQVSQGDWVTFEDVKFSHDRQWWRFHLSGMLRYQCGFQCR